MREVQGKGEGNGLEGYIGVGEDKCGGVTGARDGKGEDTLVQVCGRIGMEEDS